MPGPIAAAAIAAAIPAVARVVGGWLGNRSQEDRAERAYQARRPGLVRDAESQALRGSLFQGLSRGMGLYTPGDESKSLLSDRGMAAMTTPRHVPLEGEGLGMSPWGEAISGAGEVFSAAAQGGANARAGQMTKSGAFDDGNSLRTLLLKALSEKDAGGVSLGGALPEFGTETDPYASRRI